MNESDRRTYIGASIVIMAAIAEVWLFFVIFVGQFINTPGVNITFATASGVTVIFTFILGLILAMTWVDAAPKKEASP